MRSKVVLLLLTAIVVGLLLTGAAATQTMWAKGNFHTHTTNSDGDSAPQVVADWYKDHGYQFLIITDHGKVTDPTPLNKPGDGFVMIPGEETGVKDAKKPIHGCALGISRDLPATPAAATPAKSIQSMVKNIRKTGAMPQVNHPNWFFALTHRELLQIQGPYLLEIANMGGPTNYNEGSASYLPVEQTWDMLLSEGQTVYATATDDTHDYKNFTPENAYPGQGWVVCRVPELTPRAVLDALANGRFYASTGVELAGYGFDGKTMKVSVTPKKDQTYTIRFTGKYGRILQETQGLSATYKITGSPEKNDYVRCKVISSDRTAAWTQAEQL